MFSAFKMLFQAAATLFTAVNTVANTVNEAATYGEDEMKALNVKARLERNQRMKVIQSKYAVEDVALAQEVKQAQLQVEG